MGKWNRHRKSYRTQTEVVHKTIKGSKITRKGEIGNKALLIEQENGDKVLKLESEVERLD